MTDHCADELRRCRPSDAGGTPARTKKRHRWEGRCRFWEGRRVGGGGRRPTDGRWDMQLALEDQRERAVRALDRDFREPPSDSAARSRMSSVPSVTMRVPSGSIDGSSWSGGCRGDTIPRRRSGRHRPKVSIRLRRMTYVCQPDTGRRRNTGPRPRPSDGVP